MSNQERQLRLLTRDECGLCEDAERDLRRLGLQPEIIDIEQDDALEQRYGECIPVLMLGEEELARAPMSRESLLRLLRRKGLLT